MAEGRAAKSFHLMRVIRTERSERYIMFFCPKCSGQTAEIGYVDIHYGRETTILAVSMIEPVEQEDLEDLFSHLLDVLTSGDPVSEHVEIHLSEARSPMDSENPIEEVRVLDWDGESLQQVYRHIETSDGHFHHFLRLRRTETAEHYLITPCIRGNPSDLIGQGAPPTSDELAAVIEDASIAELDVSFGAQGPYGMLTLSKEIDEVDLRSLLEELRYMLFADETVNREGILRLRYANGRQGAHRFAPENDSHEE